MIRRPPRSTRKESSAASDVYKRQDTDLALIWEALSRRFGHVDEPERAMRRFDVIRQQDGETLTLFEQNLRILHREAWPKTDIKSPEADSLLRRKFVDGIADIELQKYLRLHAAKMMISRKLYLKLDSLSMRTNCCARRKSQLFDRRQVSTTRRLLTQ